MKLLAAMVNSPLGVRAMPFAELLQVRSSGVRIAVAGSSGKRLLHCDKRQMGLAVGSKVFRVP